MSKFAKRIKKLHRKARNVLVVGHAWGNIEDLVDFFHTVFHIDDQKRIFKSRNVVYRENFDNIHLLQDVDTILIDLDHQNHIAELFPVFNRYHSLLIIQGPDLISKENQVFLKSHNYQIVEIHKTYFQWKLK